MKIEEARLLIEKAFEEADTISHFKMKIHNVLNDIYFENGLINYPTSAEYGYEITETGDLVNQ